MVWFFNATPTGPGGPGADGAVGMIYGEPVTRAEYMDAYREAVLHHLFTYGEWPGKETSSQMGRPVEREARNRIFLARKLKALGVDGDEASAADWIVQNFSDRETKQYDSAVYGRFVQQIEQRKLKEADFVRYIKHQVGIQHLAAVAGAAGKLVTPQEAELEFRRENQKADVKVVRFPLSNYLAAVQITPEALGAFFTNRSAAYRLPERLQLSYVEFPSSNYLAQAEQTLAGLTNLAQQIDAAYLQRGPSFYADLNGQPLTADAAKARIREELKKEAALLEARKVAFDFANDLDKMGASTNLANPAENLENLAASRGAAAQLTEPFSQLEGPRGLNLPDQAARATFSLTPEAPLMIEPVVGGEAVYILALKRKIPSEPQPLDSIRERVTEDYRRAEAQKAAREAANSFLSALTNGLAGGQTFDDIAKASNVQVTDLPPFSKDTKASITGLPVQINPSTLRNIAFGLGAGKPSGYLPNSDGGFVVFAEAFMPAADDEVKTGLPEFLQGLRRQNSVAAFNDWFSKELALAQLVLSGDNEQAQESPQAQ